MTAKIIVLTIALLGFLAVPARCADDVAAAQSAINGQVEALGRDDAAGAYGYAAANVQSVFRGPDTFMSMVRNGYAPVYRHKSFEFGEATVAEGKIVQRVSIVDADGVPWQAIYTLEHDGEGAVKITGCVLLKVGQAV